MLLVGLCALARMAVGMAAYVIMLGLEGRWSSSWWVSSVMEVVFFALVAVLVSEIKLWKKYKK